MSQSLHDDCCPKNVDPKRFLCAEKALEALGECSNRELQAQVEKHLEQLKESEKTNEFLNLELARALHECLTSALKQAETMEPTPQHWIRCAAAYYVQTEDALHDTRDLDGLDDDAQLAAAILDAVGLAALAQKIIRAI